MTDGRDREDPPTTPQRVPRKPVSWPKLEAAGWDRDDPTLVLRNTLEKLEGTTEGARSKLAEQVSDARSSTRRGFRKCDARGR